MTDLLLLGENGQFGEHLGALGLCHPSSKHRVSYINALKRGELEPRCRT